MSIQIRDKYIEVAGKGLISCEGFFVMKAIRPDGTVTREASFPNLITNLGLEAFGGIGQFMYIHVGTGTTAPNFVDTALTSFGVSLPYANWGAYTGLTESPYYGQASLVSTSTVGGATGVWTEVGVSSQNTNGGLRSHALILDGGGSPTSFPVLADEQLQVTYIFRIYPPLSDVGPTSITMSGTPYNVTVRAAKVANHSNTWDGNWAGVPTTILPNASASIPTTTALQALTATSPTGTIGSFGQGTSSAAAYTPGSHYRDLSFRWGPDTAVGNIKRFWLACYPGVAQMEFDTAIPKTATQEVIVNLRYSWARR